MKCLCLGGIFNRPKQKDSSPIKFAAEKGSIEKQEIQNIKQKERSVQKASKNKKGPKGPYSKGMFRSTDKSPRGGKSKNQNKQKHFELKDQFKCLFCGGKNCPLEKYETHPNPAIIGLNSDLIDNMIYASQRPSNYLIKKHNLVSVFTTKNIGLIINLQKPGEHPYCGQSPLDPFTGFSYSTSLFSTEGIKVKICGWKDVNDIEMPSFILEIVKEMVQVIKFEKRRVFVHCHSGNSRTGIVIACYKMYIDVSEPEVAIQELQQIRPKCVTKSEEVKYVKKFYEYLSTIREIFTDTKNDIIMFLKHQCDLEYQELTPTSMYVPIIMTKCLNRLLSLKNSILNPYSNNDIYKALNGSLDIQQDIYEEISSMMEKINKGDWSVLEKCKSTVLISEILFIWLDECVKYCIKPNHIVSIYKNKIIEENIDSITIGCCTNLDTIYNIYSILKQNLKKYEMEIIQYIAKFLDFLYPCNNANQTGGKNVHFENDPAHRRKSFASRRFSKDNSDEYNHMAEKIAIFILGYDIDVLFDENQEKMRKKSLYGDSLCNPDGVSSQKNIIQSISLFDIVAYTMKVIEFVRIFTKIENKIGGTPKKKKSDNNNSKNNIVIHAHIDSTTNITTILQNYGKDSGEQERAKKNNESSQKGSLFKSNNTMGNIVRKRKKDDDFNSSADDDEEESEEEEEEEGLSDDTSDDESSIDPDEMRDIINKKKPERGSIFNNSQIFLNKRRTPSELNFKHKNTGYKVSGNNRLDIGCKGSKSKDDIIILKSNRENKGERNKSPKGHMILASPRKPKQKDGGFVLDLIDRSDNILHFIPNNKNKNSQVSLNTHSEISDISQTQN